jgi:nicotinamide-nucleotide amidase
VVVTDLNRKQSEIPEKCVPIPNLNGTAPGMWFEKETEDQHKVVYVSMPGVPFEMKPMLEDRVIPMLKKIFPAGSIVHKTILTQGVGESFLSDIIEAWETALPSFISLAYLPQPGLVRLRLTGAGDNEEFVRSAVEAEAAKLQTLIPEYIYGYENQQLEEIVGNLLKERGATLSTAESCTGGYIAHLITSIPGSSGYYAGSVIAYSNEVKIRELGVSRQVIDAKGAVSEEVVSQMATGIREKFNTTWAIATSGIAGPDGGTTEKPVGLTWIAIASPEGVSASSYLFGENRERNIRKTALQALNLLRKKMTEVEGRRSEVGGRILDVGP